MAETGDFRFDKRGSGPSRVRGSWYGARVKEKARAAALRAIGRAISKVFEDSQAEVPVLTTQLKTSGRIVMQEEKLRGSVVYGDDELRFGNKTPSSKYARRQHEDLTLNHPRGGKAKFLEDPLKRSADFFKQVLAEEIEREL